MSRTTIKPRSRWLFQGTRVMDWKFPTIPSDIRSWRACKQAAAHAAVKKTRRHWKTLFAALPDPV